MADVSSLLELVNPAYAVGKGFASGITDSKIDSNGLPGNIPNPFIALGGVLGLETNKLFQSAQIPGQVAAGTRDPNLESVLDFLPMLFGGGPAGSLGAGPSKRIVAFHGTPHTFQPVEGNPFGEFRQEAIGSGEGAQAYGYGHYVAGNPGVAVDYQRQLSGRRVVPVDDNGLPMSGTDLAEKYYEKGTIVPGYSGYDKVLGFRVELDNTGNPTGYWSVDVQSVKPTTDSKITGRSLKDAINQPDLWEPTLDRPHTHSTFPEDHEIEMIGQIRGWQMQQPGHLLEVHVRPEEHELLDWDRPFVEQHPEVQKKLQMLADKVHEADTDAYFPKSVNLNHRGEVIYSNLGADSSFTSVARNLLPELSLEEHAGMGQHETASQILHAAGIPGIKYLDAGSRGSPRISFQFDNKAIPRVPYLDAEGTERAVLDLSPEEHVFSHLNWMAEPQTEEQLVSTITQLKEGLKGAIESDKEYIQQEERGNRKHKEQAKIVPAYPHYQAALDWLVANEDKFTIHTTPQTSNYVIFHPSDLHIVARNGQRLVPVDHDPFAPESK